MYSVCCTFGFSQRPKRKPLEQFYTEDDDELIEGTYDYMYSTCIYLFVDIKFSSYGSDLNVETFLWTEFVFWGEIPCIG